MFKLSSLILISLLLSTACGHALDITQSDNGKIINVSQGDIVVIKLAENPTTGYSWQFEINPENQNIINVISSKYLKL